MSEHGGDFGEKRVSNSEQGTGSSIENKDSPEQLKEGRPMTEVLDFSNRLTRERNEHYLRTNSLRIAHLGVGGGEVVDTVLRTKPEQMREILPVVAAKITLRVFTVLQGLEEKEAIIDKLMSKFPESGCSYCGHKPCRCDVVRPEEKIGAQSSEEQRQWTIKQWQDHLKSVYGEKNHQRGLSYILNRLMSEIQEVNVAGMQMELLPEDAERYKQEAISELADSFAWAIAVCNEVDADLNKSFVDRYGKGCPNCGNMPCTCGPFTFVQERKDRRTLDKLKQ
jgi:NTP pyrophosphatase (non-canonical NTP hydrolase)